MNYQRGYQNAILEFQKKYNLRNRNVVVHPKKDQVNQPSTNQKKGDVVKKDAEKGHIPKSSDQKIEEFSKKV